MGIDKDVFYDDKKIAIIPMGFCYPGKGRSGDLPPRKECSELWMHNLLNLLPNVVLTLLVGQYAQAYHLKDRRKKSLTETVRHFRDYGPLYIPTPHPSPRNTLWIRKNSWFGEEVLPILREAVTKALSGS
jgi:uracil-DNA glycosylase